jgi:cysteine synthase
VPETTEHVKIANIEHEGGRVQRVDATNLLIAAQQAVAAYHRSSFYLNQFGNSMVAEEYHEGGNGRDHESVNVAREVLVQAREMGLPTPNHFVISAGTG